MRRPKSHDNIVVRAYDTSYCSHMPILARVLQVSNGPVMELGIGIFSTPLLHTWCDMEKRFLDSYEDYKSWVDMHHHFVTPLHHITLVEDWDTVPIEKRHWGVIFVDHAGDRRAKDAIRASNYADYVVIHDSNGRNNPLYHWDWVYPHFKYRYVFDRIHPHTTVLSNFVNLENL